MVKKIGVAYLGGGCFWCTEAIYKQVKGVNRVTPGYAGGLTPNPTYEQVSSGKTGHAEIIEVQFDPKQVSYPKILEAFWMSHDPTTLNRQGNDIGSQYRSIILYTSLEQKRQAVASKHQLEKSQVWPDPVVTEIKSLDRFYPAEDYHVDYFAKNPNQAYCQLVITPKLARFRKKWKSSS